MLFMIKTSGEQNKFPDKVVHSVCIDADAQRRSSCKRPLISGKQTKLQTGRKMTKHFSYLQTRKKVHCTAKKLCSEGRNLLLEGEAVGVCGLLHPRHVPALLAQEVDALARAHDLAGEVLADEARHQAAVQLVRVAPVVRLQWGRQPPCTHSEILPIPETCSRQ